MVTATRMLAGRYRLIEVIGQGGMAVVHRAHDEILGRDVAVKVLRPAYAQDPEFVDRFHREARHAASLHHPNIVTIHDLGVDPVTGSDFIVMQLVDGPDLQRILERPGPLALGLAVRVGIETARALAFAHDHGIVHRDIKPANILLDRDGEILVADFGIARAATDTAATASGTMLGSAQYASPEQVLGEQVGPGSDLYSLGVVLYEALTGVRPFDGPSPAAVALERLRRKPPSLTSIDPTLPRSLERLVMRLLERDPNLRPRSAADVASELERFRIAELGGVRRPGVRPRETSRAAAAATLPVADVAGLAATTPTTRRRRGGVVLPAGLGAAAVAMALLVAGTIGVIALAGNGDGRTGGVLGETLQPTRSAAIVAVASSGSVRPSPFVVPVPSPSPDPPVTPEPTPTVTPTARPVVTPTARPSPPPAPRPTPRPTNVNGAGPARDPSETVSRFYALVQTHDYRAAAALWSPRMRGEYPPSQYIDGRFDATTRIDINRIRIERMSVATREAVVSIDITEYRSSGAARRWIGTWDLVLIDGTWRMDDPHLSEG